MMSLAHRPALLGAPARPKAVPVRMPARSVPLTVTHFKAGAAEADAARPAAAVDNSVVLNYNGLEERLRLVNGRIQVSAVKDAFNLQSVKLDGSIEPVDQLGFTCAEYKPGQTVHVSGSPIAELERLRAEVAGLRAELAGLQELRADLRSVASIGSQLDSITSSYDEMRRALVSPGVSADDLAIIKRLLAEVVFGSRDGPDFTKTSQDGYTFDSWWEGRMIAKDVINAHKAAKRAAADGGAAAGAKHRSGRNNRHFHDSMDHDEVLSSFHAT